MIEPRLIDLSNLRPEEIEEKGKEQLCQLDLDLQNLHQQQETKRENCAEIRKIIERYEQQLENLNNDIQLFESLKDKLKSIPEHCANEIIKFDELNILIIKRRQNYYRLQKLQKIINDSIDRNHNNLITLQEHNEKTNQSLSDEIINLGIYEKWINILVNRAHKLFDTINELDEDLKDTILCSTDISDPVIANLKVVVDYKRFKIDRKIRWYQDSVATLENTKVRYNEVNRSIDKLQTKLKYLERSINRETLAMDKAVAEKTSVMAMFEKTDSQWQHYLEIQETYTAQEKLRIIEELLYQHWKEYCDIQQEVNINRNNLFSFSLDLSMLATNIPFIVTKRNELEAEIALRLFSQTE